MTAEPFRLDVPPIALVDDAEPAMTAVEADPVLLMLTCANCGATMDERKCKLICRCGYFCPVPTTTERRVPRGRSSGSPRVDSARLALR